MAITRIKIYLNNIIMSGKFPSPLKRIDTKDLPKHLFLCKETIEIYFVRCDIVLYCKLIYKSSVKNYFTFFTESHLKNVIIDSFIFSRF